MGGWRKLRIGELYNLNCIMRKTKLRELGRKGHVAQTGEVRNA
jgi:hypothetical protein